MLGWLLGLVNPLGAIADKLAAAYMQRSNAQTEQQRIAAEERITALEARRDVILQAQSDPFERWVRIGFALPFILYLWKIVVWDKLLGMGVTDDLSVDLWAILYIVLGGYFVDTVVRRIKQ
jgi:sterol desaturase/sphingolipid hydroxylase (fatty acid hydroxylase superfamily)